MIIDLGQYRRAKRAKAAQVQRYDEERMCVNWVPGRALSAVFSYRHVHEMSPRLPDDLTSIDVEEFMDRVYGLASQI